VPEPLVDESSRILAELAVERGLLTRGQVDEAVEVMARLAEMGVPEEFGRVLVKKGFLSDGQVRELEGRVQPKQPANIGGFEIISRLGRGGMGAVYKARQVSMDRLVALKVLPPALAKDQNFLERFFREARAVARLNHPNIVQGIDVGSADKYYYFAMEYVEGETVQGLIVRDGPMPEKKALEIVLQIAHALHHAHRHNMVHRDVKPDNIIVTPSGVAKLCDLGLAKSMAGDSAMTQTGLAVGTPHYISPEQARGDQDVDIRADIYSLGATLYHMVIGRTPFSGSSAAVVMTKHLNEAVPDPRTIRPELSAGLVRLLAKMMAKERSDRHQSPEALIGDISLALAGKLAGAPRAAFERAPAAAGQEAAARLKPISRRTTAKPVEAVGARKKPWAVLAAGAAVVLGVGVIATVALVAGKDGRTSLPPPPPPDQAVNLPPDQAEFDKRMAWLRTRLAEDMAFRQSRPDDLKEAIRRFEQLQKDAAGTPVAVEALRQTELVRAEFERRTSERVGQIEAKAKALEDQERFGEAAKLFDDMPVAVMIAARNRIDALAQSRFDKLKGDAEGIFRSGLYDAEHAGKYDEAAKGLQRAARFGLPKIDEQLGAALAALKTDHDARMKERQERLAQAETERLRLLRERFLGKRGEVFAAAARWETDKETGRYQMASALKLTRDHLLAAEMKPFAVEARRIERDLLALDAFLAKLPDLLRPRIRSNIVVNTLGKGQESGQLDDVRPAGLYLQPEGVPGTVLVKYADITAASLAELGGLSKSAADCYLAGALAFYTGRAADAVKPLEAAAADAKLKADAEYYLGIARAAYRQRREEEADRRLKQLREAFSQAGSAPKGDPRWAALRDQLEQFKKDYGDTDVYKNNLGGVPEKQE
jgi:serine/threonine-protein kinase